MSALINPAPVGRQPAAPISHWRMVLRRLRRNRLAMFGTVVILLLVICAVLASVIAPHDPVLVNPKTRLMTPGIPYLLGTDEFGRDVLSRIIYGTQISLKVGVISVGIALAAGVSLGLISGYYGGWIDNLISRVMDVFFAFPAILLAIAIMAVLGSNLTNVMIAIGIVYTPGFARVTRSAVISVRRSEYVEAAQALGATDLTIIVRHILPNSMAPIIVQTTLSLGFAILAEAALSFLGLGPEPPTPSWGLMLSTGRGFMETAPWVAIFPGVAIVLAVLSFNLLGDGLRDSLDPRLKE
jgi:peptide/nickel transport system permease protein